MNVYEYIASNNPREANYMLSGYGYKKTLSKREISENLKALVRKNKEEGLKDLADIHPDKDLILSLIEDKVTVSANEQMNFAGVSGQEYVQNLQTNTYWTPDNPKRPIAPDFFYNSNGTPPPTPPSIDEDALAEKISRDIENGMAGQKKHDELLAQMKAVQDNSTPPTGFTMTHLVILGASLFVGYMIYQNLKK